MTDVSEIKVDEFIKKQPKLSLSIYLPTHRTGRDVKQNSIRFKNLVGKIKKELSERGVAQKESRPLLEPLENLLEDTFFWNHQSDGLAIFRDNERFLKYRVPYSFPEVAMVGNGFYLKPLIPVIVKNREFYLLALDLNDLNLYHITMDGINEVDLRDVPSGIDEALKGTVFEKHLQWHTKTPRADGDRQAMFHGQGVGSDDLEKKKYISDYFRIVDKGLNRELKNKSLPLLLMGVEYLIPIYRETNSYPNLTEKGFDKDPGSLKKEELH
ncbi:MAG: hypothetical protein JXL67_14200, partial [Calditrichaeota bacterium]|nr:hypothetical protein [Calditrichota bacterium]